MGEGKWTANGRTTYKPSPASRKAEGLISYQPSPSEAQGWVTDAKNR
jgi:hypothetical protein